MSHYLTQTESIETQKLGADPGTTSDVKAQTQTNFAPAKLAEGSTTRPMTSGNLDGSIIDFRILDMLRLLEEYRRKCIKEDDDYHEARRAEDKFEKTLTKLMDKQKSQIRDFQDKELRDIEDTQKQQYIEFSEAWDEYMADYEATAYLSLEKLKDRHVKQNQGSWVRLTTLMYRDHSE